MRLSAKDLIEGYGLKPHPEGGYYLETYRAAGVIAKKALPEGFKGNRSFATAVYFLLPEGAKSRLHRLKSDELWHFHLGGPLSVVQISPEGFVEEVVLGADVRRGERLQHAVPAGWWFGAYPKPGTAYSFVTCTVSPGFDFADFELARRQDLQKRFPAAAEAIRRLT